MTPARPPLSIVVPTRDRPEQLSRCLTSIQRALDGDDELIVVDSASQNGSAIERIATEAGARYLRAPLPGVNRARNVGWRAARGDDAIAESEHVLRAVGEHDRKRFRIFKCGLAFDDFHAAFLQQKLHALF